jgi:hypothetical protein
VLAESLGADLDRDVAPEPGIMGAIDLAHPAFAKLGSDSIVGDRLVNHELRRTSDSRTRIAPASRSARPVAHRNDGLLLLVYQNVLHVLALLVLPCLR